MGKGVWHPPHRDVSHFAIIDDEQIFGEYDPKAEVDEDQLQWNFDDMKANVMALLPPSFSPSHRWIDREDNVWAENRLAMLVTNQDDCGSVSVAIVPKDDDDRLWPLALHHVDQIGPRFLAKVAELYGPLRKKTSGYTTGPYQPIALT